jgi:uncharacterized protein (DUF2126 family)
MAGVNGIRLPLVPAGPRAAVAAIRYRLFDNPWGLQPQIQAHSPLHIEIVEKSTGKRVFALDYLNWKQHGEYYDGLPDTDDEARNRVAQRVVTRQPAGRSTAGFREVPGSPHAPFTLDLRRC